MAVYNIFDAMNYMIINYYYASKLLTGYIVIQYNAYEALKLFRRERSHAKPRAVLQPCRYVVTIIYDTCMYYCSGVNVSSTYT